jgi:hypothetical protein
MSKKDKKRKKKRQDSDDYSGGGGLLTSMRGGFKNIAGTGGGKASAPKTGLKRAWDIIFWIIIAALACLAFYRYSGRR